MSSAAQDEVDALFANNRSRTTTHPEDAHRSSDISRSNSDTENTPAYSSDEDEKPKSREPSMPSAVYQLPTNTIFDANTGPKGVIADAKSFDRARKRSFRQTLSAFSNGLSGTVFGEKQKPSLPLRSREKSSSPDLSQDEDDAEFMRVWRANRMNEMQTTEHDHRTRRLSPSKRRYGSVATVDALGYLDSIERVAVETVVVVMIFDEQSTISGICEDALGNLARKHEFTRFVKMSHYDAEMDRVAVPAILAYKAGELIANLIDVLDMIPPGRDLSTSSLEQVLKQHQVLF